MGAPVNVVAEGLLAGTAEEPVLLGARSRSTGTTVFPGSLVAPGCAAEDMMPVELPRRGVLWSFTVQQFPPKSPPYAGAQGEAFRPYGIGYVDLGEVIVATRLTVADVAQLSIGMPVELVVEPFGDQVTYAFAPIEERS
jgi:uncharacterized OB-fold protein